MTDKYQLVMFPRLSAPARRFSPAGADPRARSSVCGPEHFVAMSSVNRGTWIPGIQSRTDGPIARRVRGGKRAYSLVEVLVVVTIVAILSGTATMMFSDARSVGIQTSAAQISSVLSMARDLAVTSNRRIRFIIVSNSGANAKDWRLRSYGVLKYDMDEATFKVAMPLKSLPGGIYFGEDQEGEASGHGVFDLQDQITIQGAPVDYAYIEFLPTGGTTAVSGANVFSILSGREAGAPIPGSKNYARLGVAQHTGRVRMERKE